MSASLIHTHPSLSRASLPPRPQVISELWAELPVMHNSPPPAVCLTHGRVHTSPSHSVLPPLPPLCPSARFTHVAACGRISLLLTLNNIPFYVWSILCIEGFQGGANDKEPTCQFRRRKRRGFDPWVGKIPWRRKCHPLQYSCLGNPMDRGAWRATVHGVTKSGTRLKWFSM